MILLLWRRIQNHLPVSFLLHSTRPLNSSFEEYSPPRVEASASYDVPPTQLLAGNLEYRLQPVADIQVGVGAYKAARQTLPIGALMKELSAVYADAFEKTLMLTFQPDHGGGSAVSHPITVVVKITSRMAPINYLEKNVIDLEDNNCYANIFVVNFEPIFTLANKLPLPLEYEQITGAGPAEKYRTVSPGDFSSIVFVCFLCSFPVPFIQSVPLSLFLFLSLFGQRPRRGR